MANRFIDAKDKISKAVKFLGLDVALVKLTVGQVIEIQEMGKRNEETKNDDPLEMMFKVIRMGAPEFRDMPDSEMKELPMEELATLSSEIMKYSGLGNKQK